MCAVCTLILLGESCSSLVCLQQCQQHAQRHDRHFRFCHGNIYSVFLLWQCPFSWHLHHPSYRFTYMWSKEPLHGIKGPREHMAGAFVCHFGKLLEDAWEVWFLTNLELTRYCRMWTSEPGTTCLASSGLKLQVCATAPVLICFFNVVCLGANALLWTTTSLH